MAIDIFRFIKSLKLLFAHLTQFVLNEIKVFHYKNVNIYCPKLLLIHPKKLKLLGMKCIELKIQTFLQTISFLILSLNHLLFKFVHFEIYFLLTLKQLKIGQNFKQQNYVFILHTFIPRRNRKRMHSTTNESFCKQILNMVSNLK